MQAIDAIETIRERPIEHFEDTPGVDCPERFFRGVALALVLSVPLWAGIGMALHWALA